MSKKVALIILDGWGIGDKSKSDAIFNSKVPFYNFLLKNYPNSTLQTSGEAVGLPPGQMGNSEVGHLNIGAGRVVYQQLVLINKAFKERKVFENQVLKQTLEYIKTSGKKLHLMGLLSEGGVHSSLDHLEGLADYFYEQGLEQFFLHAFMDGRDTDPKSGVGYLNRILPKLEQKGGKLASIIGRYYAMDRDNRWERVKLAYDLMVKGEGSSSNDAINSLKNYYQEEVTDEFMKPIVMEDKNGKPVALIAEGDAVICFNFRTDRAREITVALTQKEFPEYQMTPLKLHYCTLTRYDETFKNVHVVFENQDLTDTLGEVLARNGRKQCRIAETEKYPHVTFFFSGGRELPYEGETRHMCASPKVATYDLQPEMSAECVMQNTLNEIEKNETDLIVVNFANPDMVGHTGIYEAVQKAVERVDKCTEQIVNIGLERGYEFIIIADHGNADYMINPDGSPNTAHTTNPVPCIYVSGDENVRINSGKLADIAPTILHLLKLPVPEAMDGKNLITIN